MGIFRLGCEIVNISDPDSLGDCPGAARGHGIRTQLVPEAVLHQVGVQVVKKDLRFRMANGQTITRSTGYAILRASGFETVA